MAKLLKIGTRVVFYALGLFWILYFAHVLIDTAEKDPSGFILVFLIFGLLSLLGLCTCVKALLCLRFSLREGPSDSLKTGTWILILADAVLYHLAFILLRCIFVVELFILWLPCAVASLIALILLGREQRKFAKKKI